LKNYLTAGIGFTRLIRLVRRNSISFHPKYIFRFLFLLQSSVWTELFSRIELKRYGKKISSIPVPEDPIFIIGHWRTGTTLLHQMMSLDPNLAAPTLFQVAEPQCFICSYGYYLPLFSALIDQRRPMDNVRLGMNEPQEDEYAIYRITDFSPIEQLVFPKDKRYFILDNPSFLPLNEIEKKEWEEQLCNYFRKLYFFNRKTIVSKNPFNSFRIKELCVLFPKARFIHIVRHPFEVVPSTVNMWRIVLKQNRLTRNGSYPGIEEVAKGFEKLLTTIKTDYSVIPQDNFFEMKFEDFEADPVAEIKKIYTRFHMPINDVFSLKIQSFIDSMNSYRKNEFHLAGHEKELIRIHLSQHMQFFNYQ
jgi:hypothetical protein